MIWFYKKAVLKPNWQTRQETIDMAKNGKRAWSLSRKISIDPSYQHSNSIPPRPTQYRAYSLRISYCSTGNPPPNSQERRPSSALPKHWTDWVVLPWRELNISIKALKTGKAIGLDNIFRRRSGSLELWHEIGPWADEQLHADKKHPNDLEENQKQPSKDPAYAKSVHPISLLCHPYKQFEHLILNRLTPVAEPAIIPQQAG